MLPYPPLVWCIQCRSLADVRKSLELGLGRGAYTLEMRDAGGYTPCIYAAISGSVPVLRALAAGGPGGVLAGDAVNAVNGDGRTALDYAGFFEFAAVLRDELGGKRAAEL